MSATKAVTVWCDGQQPNGDRCPEWTGGGMDHRIADARRTARVNEGWVYRNGLDLCRRCKRGDQA